MQFMKLLGGAGLLIATALVGGTLIGSALALPSTSDTPDADAVAHGGALGEYCDVFLDTFSAELGVTRDDVAAAGTAAATAAIDAAVAAGDLDADRAQELKDRLAEADGEGCDLAGFRLGGFGHGFARGFGHGFVGSDVLDAAAEALGLESADLIERAGDGVTLEEIATEEGVSYDDVKAAVLAELESDLDAAVAEGLSQERADSILERTTTWLDEGGELRGRGHRRP